jgi:hypothetical protein
MALPEFESREDYLGFGPGAPVGGAR